MVQFGSIIGQFWSIVDIIVPFGSTYCNFTVKFWSIKLPRHFDFNDTLIVFENIEIALMD